MPRIPAPWQPVALVAAALGVVLLAAALVRLTERGARAPIGEEPPLDTALLTPFPTLTAVPLQPAATPYPFTGRFETLPPGAPLPSGQLCAERVRRSGWEARPENAKANRTRGAAISRIDGASTAGNARLAPRIDGDFTGTTDEILQWGACK